MDTRTTSSQKHRIVFFQGSSSLSVYFGRLSVRRMDAMALAESQQFNRRKQQDYTAFAEVMPAGVAKHIPRGIMPKVDIYTFCIFTGMAIADIA